MPEGTQLPVIQPTVADAAPSPEYRLALREKIAQGMASARAGRLTDGEAVFARHFAELDALEADVHR
jgi:predicted transcriptional regulator